MALPPSSPGSRRAETSTAKATGASSVRKTGSAEADGRLSENLLAALQASVASAATDFISSPVYERLTALTLERTRWLGGDTHAHTERSGNCFFECAAKYLSHCPAAWIGLLPRPVQALYNHTVHVAVTGQQRAQPASATASAKCAPASASGQTLSSRTAHGGRRVDAGALRALFAEYMRSLTDTADMGAIVCAVRPEVAANDSTALRRCYEQEVLPRVARVTEYADHVMIRYFARWTAIPICVYQLANRPASSPGSATVSVAAPTVSLPVAPIGGDSVTMMYINEDDLTAPLPPLLLCSHHPLTPSAHFSVILYSQAHACSLGIHAKEPMPSSRLSRIMSLSSARESTEQQKMLDAKAVETMQMFDGLLGELSRSGSLDPRLLGSCAALGSTDCRREMCTLVDLLQGGQVSTAEAWALLNDGHSPSLAGALQPVQDVFVTLRDDVSEVANRLRRMAHVAVLTMVHPVLVRLLQPESAAAAAKWKEEQRLVSTMGSHLAALVSLPFDSWAAVTALVTHWWEWVSLLQPSHKAPHEALAHLLSCLRKAVQPAAPKPSAVSVKLLDALANHVRSPGLLQPRVVIDTAYTQRGAPWSYTQRVHHVFGAHLSFTALSPTFAREEADADTDSATATGTAKAKGKAKGKGAVATTSYGNLSNGKVYVGVSKYSDLMTDMPRPQAGSDCEARHVIGLRAGVDFGPKELVTVLDGALFSGPSLLFYVAHARSYFHVSYHPHLPSPFQAYVDAGVLANAFRPPVGGVGTVDNPAPWTLSEGINPALDEYLLTAGLAGLAHRTPHRQNANCVLKYSEQLDKFVLLTKDVKRPGGVVVKRHEELCFFVDPLLMPHVHLMRSLYQPVTPLTQSPSLQLANTATLSPTGDALPPLPPPHSPPHSPHRPPLPPSPSLPDGPDVPWPHSPTGSAEQSNNKGEKEKEKSKQAEGGGLGAGSGGAGGTGTGKGTGTGTGTGTSSGSGGSGGVSASGDVCEWSASVTGDVVSAMMAAVQVMAAHESVPYPFAKQAAVKAFSTHFDELSVEARVGCWQALNADFETRSAELLAATADDRTRRRKIKRALEDVHQKLFNLLNDDEDDDENGAGNKKKAARNSRTHAGGGGGGGAAGGGGGGGSKVAVPDELLTQKSDAKIIKVGQLNCKHAYVYTVYIYIDR